MLFQTFSCGADRHGVRNHELNSKLDFVQYLKYFTFTYNNDLREMELQEHIYYWLKSAAHDLETAETLFDNKRYDWCLFLGHLAIEKGLKALFVRDNENHTPPFTHNLSLIASRTNLNLTPDQEKLLLELNQFNIRTRYPDYKFEFYKKCTFDFTQPYLSKIKELYNWLLEQI